MKRAKRAAKRSVREWAAKFRSPETSVLAWNAPRSQPTQPSESSVKGARHLVGAYSPERVNRVAGHIDAILAALDDDGAQRANG
jgi:hypothetical protein